MPIYRIRCSSCDKQEDIFRSIANMDELPDCCGERMGRMVCAPMVTTDIPAYQSMATGEIVEGRAAHREHLKRNRLIEVGNEVPKPSTPKNSPEKRREEIARVVYDKLRYA